MFTADIIQPLFDLANSGSDLHRQVEEQVKRGENQNAAGGKAAPKAGSIQVVNQNNSSGGNQNSGNYRIWDVSRSPNFTYPEFFVYLLFEYFFFEIYWPLFK